MLYLKNVEEELRRHSAVGELFKGLTQKQQSVLIRVVRDLAVQYAADQVEEEHRRHVAGDVPCLVE